MARPGAIAGRSRSPAYGVADAARPAGDPWPAVSSADPGQGQRFHRTLNAEVLSGSSFRDLAECQRAFTVWREVYNHHRPHQALGLDTPDTRYRMSPRAFPEHLSQIEYGHGDIVRKVDPNGKVSFKGRRFRIGKAFCDQFVALRPTGEDGVLGVYFCAQDIGTIDLGTDEPNLWTVDTPRRVAHRVHRPTAASEKSVGIAGKMCPRCPRAVSAMSPAQRQGRVGTSGENHAIPVMTHDDIAVPSPHGWENVADAIFHNARRRPTHPAIVDGPRTITYAELAGLVARTAGHIEGIGARQGDIIGVVLGDNADHIVALLAIAWLAPSSCRWTCAGRRRRSGVSQHTSAAATCWFPGTTRRSTASRRSRSTRHGTARSTGHGGNGSFVRRRDQPLLLSLSSGTTGTPKGPLVTHGHTLSRLFIYAFSLTFNEADRFITATPLYFGGARYMTMAYLFMGATVVLFPPPYEPDSLVQAVNDQNITALFLVPTLLRACSTSRSLRSR